MDELADPIVYLNGDFLPLSKAYIHVLDRGFIFGDSIYEVLPVYNGRILKLAEHIKRLQDSLTAISIQSTMTDTKWENLLIDLVGKNGGQNLAIYIQITRGVSKREHTLTEEVPLTIFAMCSPLNTDHHDYKGINATTHEDIRWQYCHIKATTLLPNILLKQKAKDADAKEVILIRDGFVTEGAASNVFIVTGKMIKTPKKGLHILPGITRDLVIELLAKHSFQYEQTPISKAVLQAADEIWLTSSTREIIPVTKLDNQIVGNGKPGYYWKEINALYQQYKMTLTKC